MSSCGGFYGRVDSLISTPTSRTSLNDAHNSQRGLTNPSPGSTPVNLSRNNSRALEQKVDDMLLALEEQKKENSEILSQLKSLQETVGQSMERASTKKKRIPFSLSVSGGIINAY